MHTLMLMESCCYLVNFSCDESAPGVVMSEQHLHSCLSTNLRE